MSKEDRKPCGIAVRVANLVPGQVNEIAPPEDERYVARALLWPPPAPPNAAQSSSPQQYTFALYVSRVMKPVSVYIPNIQGFLFADLPSDVAPKDLLGAIDTAIDSQIEGKPNGTGI
jgi:hypothetical protein